MIILVVALLAAGGYCGWRYYNDVYLPNKQITDADNTQRELFESIRPDIAGTPRDEGDEPANENDLCGALEIRNSDSVGWLTIDGTVIDYPVVQTEDNTFYLEHSFDRKYNYVGCPFLDYRCKSDFTGFNSIIYAHHLSGYPSMFTQITYFKDSDYMREHPTAVLLTKKGVRTVRFFAYMIVPNPSFAYVTDIGSQDEKNNYIDDIFDNAEYTSGYTSDELKEKKDLRLLLLSTCTYEFWQARGVLVGVIE